MECYEGATMIKSFRGSMLDGAQDTIVLHTNDGSTGYRIVKFEILPTTPGDANAEHCVKIYKVSQSTIDDNIDFSDNTLLGAAIYASSSSTSYQFTPMSVIFDNEIFNQDIFVTQKDTQGGAINYYIELEQMKLDLSESTVATLKDIRNKELRTMTA